MKRKVIILGADHAGFAYKERIKKYFGIKGQKFEDYGAFLKEQYDDYPDYAFKVAERVAIDRNSLGILFCGTGAGMVIAANKVKGARAVEASDEKTAELSRAHNNSNILGIGARTISYNKAVKVINKWIKSDFSSEKRHIRRLKKIETYENEC